jgi:pimeloyl-ACP methyl ester carboxylesterase
LIAAAKLPKKVCAVVTRGCRADLAKKSLPHVLCPTLLIVGEDDTVDVELNREGLALLGGRKELQVIPGASHLFGEPGKLEIMSQMSAEWFRRFAVPDHR